MKYFLCAMFAAAAIFMIVVSGVVILPTVSVAQGVDEAKRLNQQAIQFYQQRRYADAEPLFKRSLAISEKALGPDHPDVATALNNLAQIYESQGRYADSEPLYKRSRAIFEKALGPDHTDVARLINNL